MPELEILCFQLAVSYLHAMTRIEEVERKQAELDALYASLVARAGDPAIEPMLLYFVWLIKSSLRHGVRL